MFIEVKKINPNPNPAHFIDPYEDVDSDAESLPDLVENDPLSDDELEGVATLAPATLSDASGLADNCDDPEFSDNSSLPDLVDDPPPSNDPEFSETALAILDHWITEGVVKL